VRILIPGISGLLGRLCAERFVELGHEVAGLDRRPYRDAPPGVHVHEVDIRKRAAEDVFRTFRPEVVVHMATVNHLAARGEERYRINLGGTRTVFEHCRRWGVEHAVFVGRHTFYGASAESPLYHTEDEPPMGLATFPELADLVAADLYAGSELWRFPELTTSVLRFCYTLGPSGHGTLASFLRGGIVPAVLGFDPLFQFMHEADVIEALVKTIEARPRGVFNVAGPPPVPLSILARETGRSLLRLPEPLYASLLGRLGLPRLPRGALSHVKFPIVVDAGAFRRVTGFEHRIDEARAMAEYRSAFPPRPHHEHGVLRHLVRTPN
jgi:UDP-glucose 4-epimerase